MLYNSPSCKLDDDPSPPFENKIRIALAQYDYQDSKLQTRRIEYTTRDVFKWSVRIIIKKSKTTAVFNYLIESAGTRCTWCAVWWRWQIFWLPGTVFRRSTAGWAAQTRSPRSCANATGQPVTRPCPDVGSLDHRLWVRKNVSKSIPIILIDNNDNSSLATGQERPLVG